jgi:ankyrin repeat protein
MATIWARTRGLWIGLAAFTATGAGMIVLTPPAHAQFASDSYTFLKAVRERDGGKAQPLLDKPGTTIINSRDPNTGEAALHIVVKGRDAGWTRFMISRGADLNMRDGSGETPLTSAVRIGWDDGVQLLLSQGAKADLPNSRGETPLIVAVQTRDLVIVRQLVAAGANPAVADRVTGQSAKDYAARDPRAAPIAKLLDEAKVKPKTISGPTM